MKKTKTCPKCEGHSIYLCPAQTVLATNNDYFVIINGLIKNITVRYERYVCATCGYMEEYVPVNNLSKLEEAEEKGLIEKI